MPAGLVLTLPVGAVLTLGSRYPQVPSVMQTAFSFVPGFTLPFTLPTFTGSGGPASGSYSLPSLTVGGCSTTQPSSASIGSPVTSTLTCGGPYNPSAVLPPKVAKKILELEYVEMSEITGDDLPTPMPGQPPLPARPPVQNISVWVEKFSIMAALIASRFPQKAPELFAYQASIVRAERNFADRRWVAYDRCYRREALAQKSLDWSMPNARLYNEAFTGHARTIPRCSFCLQEDHLARACPRNPNRPWFGWYSSPSAVPSQQAGQLQELCRRFNNGRCKQPAFNCRYAHRCAECGGPHSRLSCSRGGQRGSARPRSPIQPLRQQTRFPGASTTGPATGQQDPASGCRF